MRNIKQNSIIGISVVVLTATACFVLIQTLIKSRDRYLYLTEQLVELQAQGAVIQAAYAKKVSSTISSGASGFCYTFEGNVSDENIAGDKDKIKKVQEILEREGIEISDEEKNSLTFEETSRSAISLFQEKYTEEILSPAKLKESNGILDRLTIKKMNELYGCKKDTVPDKKYNKSRILVKFKEGTADEKINEVIAKQKTSISPEDKRDAKERKRFMMIKPPEGKSAEDTVEAYKKEPDVEYAELDYKAQASSPAIVNDPYALMQLSLYRMGVLSNEGTGAFNLASNFNQNVKVAIVDSGIDGSHPDLQGRVIANKNFSDSSTYLPTECSHGNYMAGIVAATTDNALGVTGAAHNVSLINAKVLGGGCWAWWSDVASGVYWAVDNGADVINMSLGSTDGSTSLLMALNYAQQQGVVTIGAAGNDNLSQSFFPASAAGISVAATNLKDAKMSYSNYGSGVDVAAPAAQVYSTTKTGYGLSGGTSAASAEVSGLAALILATGQCSLKSEGCVINKIEGTADKIAGTGSYWQYGRVNAFEALGGTNYKEPVFKTLAVKKSGTGSGIVRTTTPLKAAINCGSKCSASLALNSDITIKAIADTGSKFIKWSGGPCKGSTSATCAFTFNPDPEKSSQTAYAVFELVKPLVIQKSGTGSGTVKATIPLNAINCGTKCSANFAVNSALTLSATPAAGSKFVNWTSDGPCNGLATTTCAFTFNPAGSSQTIMAVFDIR